jgi:hypothetical protein
MNFAGFLPYGILMVAFAVAVHRGIRAEGEDGSARVFLPSTASPMWE